MAAETTLAGGRRGPPGLADINTRWHKIALSVFLVIVLAHWAEHVAQAIQIWVLGQPVPDLVDHRARHPVVAPHRAPAPAHPGHHRRSPGGTGRAHQHPAAGLSTG